MSNINLSITGNSPHTSPPPRFSSAKHSTKMPSTTSTLLNDTKPMVNTLASTSQTEGKVENQIVDLNPISVLLQKSQKAPGQVLQIPTDLRTSLLTSNESLKQNVSLLNSGFTNVKHENSAIREDLQTLRNENNFLRQDIQSLQSYSDVQFRGFPRLPIEIQQIIWQYYLVLPQVIALDVTYTKGRPPWPVLILYGPSCPLLQVCKDSRTEARKKYPQQIQGQSYLDMLPNRLDLHNQASDTLWRVGKDIRPHSNFIYETLEAICDEIDILAIPYQQWYYSLADQENSIENLIDSFCLSEVQELILVMGDPSLSTRQDLTFVAPKLLPETVISLSSDLVQQFDTLDSKFLVCLAENNWDLLAKHSTDMLQAVANNYQQLRKEALASGVSEYDLNPENTQYQWLHECRYWELPNIKFMEISTLEEERRLGNIC